MQLNIEDLIGNWFKSATPQEQIEFLKNLLVSTVSKPTPTNTIDLKPKPVKQKQTKEKARKPSIHIQPTILGKTYKSMKAAAEHFGIPYHTVQYRKERGQTIEQIYREAYQNAKKNKVMRRLEDGSITVATVGNS